MKIIFYSTLIAASVILGSCQNSKSESEVIYSKLLKLDTIKASIYSDSLVFNNGYKLNLDRDSIGNICQIEGKLVGRKYGPFFSFNCTSNSKMGFPLGKLEQFYFHSPCPDCYSYNIEYDSKTNKYSEIGSPKVDYMIITPEENDSLSEYNLLFSSFPRTDIKASYSKDGKSYSDLALRKSDKVPLVEEATLKLNRSIQFITVKTSAKNMIFNLTPLPDSMNFIDTVFFFR